LHQPDTATHLSNFAYDDGNAGPALSDPYAVRSQETFPLSADPVAAVGAALPRGNPGDSDYDDGRESKIGTAMGALGLAGTILENLKDEKGNKVGDIKLNIERTNGKVNAWNIQKTTIGIDGKSKTSTMTEGEAKQYLADNKDKLIANGVYGDVEKALDN